MTQSIPGTTAQPPDLDSKSKHQPNLRLLIPLGIVAIAGVGVAIWYFLSPPVEQGLQVSGRIEGYETDVRAKTGGRIDFIGVREGDKVKTGQLLVRIDDSSGAGTT
jgi:HlyD family secretion protein